MQPSFVVLLRRMRIGIFVACLAILGAAVGLWILTSSALLVVQGPLALDNYFQLFAQPGRVRTSVSVDNRITRWGVYSEELEQVPNPSLDERFHVYFDRDSWSVVAPQSFWVLVAGMFAVLTWPGTGWRFSLRRLLVLTTAVTLYFGIVAATERSLEP